MTTPTPVTARPYSIVEVLVGDVVKVLSDGPVMGSQGPASTTTATTVRWTGSAWPARPPGMSNAVVFWLGGSTAPPGALDDDIWIRGT
jgi:hypothetical protein